jgi:very-short-patch-repair endonuclease
VRGPGPNSLAPIERAANGLRTPRIRTRFEKTSDARGELLWERLRGSRFHGAKFRRQAPFDRFVVDFYCHPAKLIVEIDGKQHEWFSGYDKERTEILERLGLHVIRFTNAEVCDDLDFVLARIYDAMRLPFD